VKRAAAIERRLGRMLAEQPPRATSLIVSVFGDAVAPHGGAIGLGSLIRWLAPFGINERAVRTAVGRLAREDWIQSRSRGRRSDYLLTETSRRRFADAERRIYATLPPPWDGSWCMVLLGHGAIRVEERDAARRELRWHGFGELGASVWLHPEADVRELRLVLEDLRLAGRALVLDADAAGGPSPSRAAVRTLVHAAWDVSDLGREYDRYVRRFQAVVDPIGRDGGRSDETAFVLRVLAVHEYRRILLRDPELPGGVLGEDWAGERARSVCASVYRVTAARARRFILATGRTSSGVLSPPTSGFAKRFAQ
jgi:phenylacetic acid degradation operon negative regulatory protein